MKIGDYDIESMALGYRGGRWEVRWRRQYECCGAVSDERAAYLGACYGVILAAIAWHAHERIESAEATSDAEEGKHCPVDDCEVPAHAAHVDPYIKRIGKPA